MPGAFQFVHPIFNLQSYLKLYPGSDSSVSFFETHPPVLLVLCYGTPVSAHSSCTSPKTNVNFEHENTLVISISCDFPVKMEEGSNPKPNINYHNLVGLRDGPLRRMHDIL